MQLVAQGLLRVVPPYAFSHSDRCQSPHACCSNGLLQVELLRAQGGTRRAIHRSHWDNGSLHMMAVHQTAMITELQLLHVTRDVQAALRDPGVVMRLNTVSSRGASLASTGHLTAATTGGAWRFRDCAWLVGGRELEQGHTQCEFFCVR